jgi:hypothetical protein
LMAWPQGWTELEPLAMVRFLSWQQLLLSYFLRIWICEHEKNEVCAHELTAGHEVDFEYWQPLPPPPKTKGR